MIAAVLSKERSSLKSYFCYYKKWRNYAEVKGLAALPADEIEFSMFLLEILDLYSWQVIKQIVAAVNFFHRAFGFSTPGNSNPLVQEYVFKQSKKPVLRREPVLVSHLTKIFSCLNFEKCSLFYLRNVAIMIVGFFGFLRFSELQKLRFCDLNFMNDRIEIKIRRSKTDKGRVGQKVCFDFESFPGVFLHVYIRRFAFQSRKFDNFVFMSMRKGNEKSNMIVNHSIQMSYKAFRRALDSLFVLAGIPNGNIMMHSLRIGGASAASELGVPDFKIDANGRWVPDRARKLYQRPEVTGEKSISMMLSAPFR